MPAMTATLKLAYDFSPKPNPMLASVSGVNANIIELQIVISNPLRSTVGVSKITIEIPLGQDISRDLSTNPSLPSPLYDATGPWSISAESGTVTIGPKDGDVGHVTAPIIFSLPGIGVNSTPGAVPLTVTEFPPPPAGKVEDATTYKLHKQPADFPVANFRAEPAMVTDLHQQVTLRWDTPGKINGADPVFGLEANRGPMPSKNCVADGDCYTRQDGIDGVIVPEVSEATTFTLRVVTSSGEGHRTLFGTLTTTVQNFAPSISQLSYVESALGGRVLRMYWEAFNAKACTVVVDDAEIDHAAPMDTYRKGYVVVPPDRAERHTSAVIAQAVTGGAKATLPLLEQRVTPVTKIDDCALGPGAITVTHDGTLALVTNSSDTNYPTPYKSSITFIDLATRKADPTTLFVPGIPNLIAMVPNSTLALVTTWDASLRVVDVPGRKVEPTVIPVGNREWLSLAITSTGKTALVAGMANRTVAVIDIPGRKVEATIQTTKRTNGIAITPDDKLAFVTNDDGTVTVLDVVKRTVDPTPITVDNEPANIAITPDGSLALVLGLEGSVAVIDVTTRTIEAKMIPTGSQPRALVISPDGALALTANDEKSVTIIDVARRTSTTLAWWDPPTAIGITPDGKTALVAAGHEVDFGNDTGNVGLI